MTRPYLYMKRFLAIITSPPLILAAIAAFAYGILAPQLGFYWDDLPIGWIRYELGTEALSRYFSTNRPAMGILYQGLTGIIPFKPIYWQFLALILRWISSVLFWAIFRQLFPRQKTLSIVAGLLFLLYPGFNQQFISFVYSSHFFTLVFFLLSIFAMLKRTQIWTIAALLASTINLLLGEYFFLLDLIRIPILWTTLGDFPNLKERVRRVFLAWSPYLGILLVMIIGRVFFISNETYGYSLLAELRAAPLLTLRDLIKTVFLSLWTTLIAAWGQAFVLPDFELQGKVTIAIYLLVIIFSLAATLFAYHLSPARRGDSRESEGEKQDAIRLIFLGFFAALLAGIPFWMTGLPVSLGFPANRATLPFILGSVLVLVGFLTFLPRKNLRLFIFALLIAFSAGRQFLWADEFRRDWNVQKNLFWQLSWRVPAIEEDTAILLNEGALKFYADNSLSAPLNWIYAPKATEAHIPYMLFYPRSRLGQGIPALEKGHSLTHDFIAGEFHGNTSQMILVNFSPPGCVHIVDPEIDTKNRFISDILLRDAASLSRPELILPFGEPQLPDIYAPEPAHGWCYYFEKADLARQFGDWDQVVALGAQAFNTGDHPNDPTENFVFIEGYAFTGDWAQAEQLSVRANRVSPSYMAPLLCPLWERIEANTIDGLYKTETLIRVREKLNCK
ncbi:MAG: hypothetical protein ISR59_13480 [Anaerolineales bacterium]|nr:hypothetical protein [Anaerolineales bacterium]